MVEKIEQTICYLELVSTFIVPATIKFLAIEKFVCDISSKAKVKINYIDNNFKEWFLSDDGKIEDPIGGDILRYFKLRKSSLDSFIMKELGGKAKAETTLSKMFSLMENKKNGESGILLDNGSANIFYIKDKNAVLRAVCVYWDSVGWMIKARSVGSPNECNGGSRVFSRYSDLNLESFASAQA